MRIWLYVSRHRRQAVRFVVWTAVVSSPAAASGRLVALAVDAAVSHRGWLAAAWLGLLAVLGVAASAATLRAARAQADLVLPVTAQLIRDVTTGVLQAGIEDERRRALGGAELGQVRVFMAQFEHMMRNLPRAVAALAALMGMATISRRLTLILAPFLVVCVAIIVIQARVVARRMETSLILSEDQQSQLAAAAEAARDLVAYGARDRELERLGRTMRAARRAELELSYADTLFTALRGVFGVAGPLLVAMLALPVLIRDGEITVGGAVGTVTYAVQGIAQGASMAAIVVSSLVQARVALSRLSTHIRPVPEPRRDTAYAGPATLQCKRVTFSFATHAVPIVAGLSLDLPEGDHLAIVGPSGIGKSTLASLLGGVLRPQQGTITVSGTPVSDLLGRSSLVAIVPQESYVFAGSLRENLAYLNPEATDAQMLAAADAVGLDRVLDRLGSLDASIDVTKSGLSEGEKQLVTLTRTYISPARIVILDEATCYLDPAAEERAEGGFISRGGTLVVIAHRMSSSLRARRVLVMDGPHPALGTHNELLRSNPLYADLQGLWATSSDRA